MLRLSVRFGISCTEPELLNHLDALEEALKKWNDRRPAAQKLWCNVAVGNTHKPPHAVGGREMPAPVERYAEVSTEIRIDHPLSNIDLARTALVELVLTFDSVLYEREIAPNFPVAVFQHGFTAWRRNEDMTVSHFEQAA